MRNRPALFTLGVILFFVGLGLADRGVQLHGQLVLGAITWVVLLAAMAGHYLGGMSARLVAS